MTVKPSTSFPDDLYARAKARIDAGFFPTFSAYLQHLLAKDLEEQDAKAAAQKAEVEALEAFKNMLVARTKGPFVPEEEFWKLADADIDEERRARGLAD